MYDPDRASKSTYVRLSNAAFIGRAAEKQASRDADARAIATGTKTVSELQRQNSFLPLNRKGKIDYLSVSRIR